MTQQSSTAERRPPNWIADLVVGGTAALLAVTVAQAALPGQSARLAKLDLSQRAAPAEAPAAPVEEPASVQPTDIVFGEPVTGYPVISPFGLRKLPWEEHGRLHQGVDIAAPFGLPVRAIADGVVVRAGQDGAYGRFVEVRHADGLNSFYAHLGGFTANAQAGAAVKRGEPIGKVGSSGSSTGAHLHIEIRRHGRPLNPSYFIGKTYASAEELPLRQAAYVPRRVRIAYVSYIPKSKRQKMEAREEARQLADESRRLNLREARMAALTKLPVEQVPVTAPAKVEMPAMVDMPVRNAEPAAAQPAAQTGASAASSSQTSVTISTDANGRVRATIDPGG
ncbi:MAG: M23 family metallopeptidase [Phenylobacterium sp.]|uniref:M23 family metallopeptidase n=1 Tax=Phenylobacterium sp. TaxID=1871053 RepID=UPI002A3644D3|nr:M23 family metallopeptidase [Phenylobacterium sp.]MDX9999091.1 M23 family metallopeptidase [Phenylobacterium sp.]